MSVWSRVQTLLRRARDLGPLPRRLISGISRLGKGAAVTPTKARGPLVKFTIRFSYRHGGSSIIDYDEVLEISPPVDLVEDLGELGRWVRENFYGGEGFVRILGIQRRAVEVPTEPRLSLPRALGNLRRSPAESAIRALNDLPRRGRRWYGYITLDLDDVRPDARSVRRWAKRVGLRRQFVFRRSSSGLGTHVRFRIREGIAPREALALRVALGDDPIRAAIDATRYAYQGKGALRGVLFDQKGADKAGVWRSLLRDPLTTPPEKPRRRRDGRTRAREKPSEHPHPRTTPRNPRERTGRASRAKRARKRTRRSG